MVDKPAVITARAPVPTAALATQTQARPSKTQLGKRPQYGRKHGDTYIPSNTYISDYSTQFSMPELGDLYEWFNEARPSNPRLSSQVVPPSP